MKTTLIILLIALLPAVIRPVHAQQAAQTDTLKETWALQGARSVLIDLPAGRVTLLPGKGDAIQAQGQVFQRQFLRHGSNGQQFRLYWQAPLAQMPRNLDLQLSLPPMTSLMLRGMNLDVQFKGPESETLTARGNQLRMQGPLKARAVDIQSLQGNLDLQLKNNDSARVDLLNGHVHMQGLQGHAELRLLNGNLEVAGSQLQSLILNNQNGSIALQGNVQPGGRVEVQTLNGNIQAAVSDSPYRCRFETLNGGWSLNDTPMPLTPADGSTRQIDCSPPDLPADKKLPTLLFRSQNGSLTLKRN